MDSTIKSLIPAFFLVLLYVPLSGQDVRVTIPRIKSLERTNFSTSLFLGYDFERTERRYASYTPRYSYFNFGIQHRQAFQGKWSLQYDLWLNSTATPYVQLIKLSKEDLDGQRYLVEDTTALTRLRGFSLGLSMVRKLPYGIHLIGGAQFAYFNSGLFEGSRSSRSTVDLDTRSSSGGLLAFSSTEDWIRRFHPMLRFGVEKDFFKVVCVGINFQQSLADLTKVDSGRPNLLFNYHAYVGLRYFW
jgi:hypothetical protein